MVPFRVPIIIRHLIFRVPKRDHNFDNHSHGSTSRLHKHSRLYAPCGVVKKPRFFLTSPHMSSVFWWLNPVRLCSLHENTITKRRNESYPILGTIVSPNKILLTLGAAHYARDPKRDHSFDKSARMLSTARACTKPCNSNTQQPAWS